MRFEESQVSVFNPETGVNTVEASIFMILRGGPTHTCDIKMQQVPTMFGNAPGIMVRSRVLCSALLLCTALLGGVGPSRLSLSFSMLVMLDVCLVWRSQGVCTQPWLLWQMTVRLRATGDLAGAFRGAAQVSSQLRRRWCEG